MIAELAINTCSSHYKTYQKLEETYKTEMYRVVPDPKSDRLRARPEERQQMDYAEDVFGNDLVKLILQSGMEIIDERASDPKIYQELRLRVSWLNQPEDPVRIETQWLSKSGISWGLRAFFVKHFVKTIPLPDKIESTMPFEIFKIDNIALIEDLMTPESQQKMQPYGERYNKELINKVNSWIAKAAFKANPVQFLFDWREKHSTIKLISFKGNSAFYYETQELTHSQQIKRDTYLLLAKAIIQREEYTPSFLAWLKANYSQIIRQQYAETDHEPTLAKIEAVFLVKINSVEFEEELKILSKLVVEKIVSDERLGSIQDIFSAHFVSNGALFHDKKNIIDFLVKESVLHVLQTYFALTYNPESQNIK